MAAFICYENPTNGQSCSFVYKMARWDYWEPKVFQIRRYGFPDACITDGGAGIKTKSIEIDRKNRILKAILRLFPRRRILPSTSLTPSDTNTLSWSDVHVGFFFFTLCVLICHSSIVCFNFLSNMAIIFHTFCDRYQWTSEISHVRRAEGGRVWWEHLQN